MARFDCSSDRTGPDSRLAAIRATVAAIPAGQLATYGQIARLAGFPGLARFVGYTLSQLDENNTLPWHRVVNASGRVSFPENSPRYHEQVSRLRAEGIGVNQGRIQHFKRLCWAS